jgi:hypothetical protein
LVQVIDEGDDIGAHWDRDYEMEEYGVNVHPHIATVTYLHLNQRTAPTIVFPQSIAPQSVGEDFSQTCDSIFIAYPSEGKHMSFDGRLLHAAPDDLTPPDTFLSLDKRTADNGKKQKRRKRVTFLVNIWLNHFPLTAQVLGNEQIQKMGCLTWETLNWKGEELVKNVKAPTHSEVRNGGDWGIDLEFVVENRKASAHIELPQKNYDWQKSDLLGASLMVNMKSHKIIISRGEEVVTGDESGDEEDSEDCSESDSGSEDDDDDDDGDNGEEEEAPKKKVKKG